MICTLFSNRNIVRVWHSEFDELNAARLLVRCVSEQPAATAYTGTALLALVSAMLIDAQPETKRLSRCGARFLSALLSAVSSTNCIDVRNGCIATLLALAETAPNTFMCVRQPFAALLPLHSTLSSSLADRLVSAVDQHLQLNARLTHVELQSYCLLFASLRQKINFFEFAQQFQRHVASGRLDTVALRTADLLPILFAQLDTVLESNSKLIYFI